MSPLTTSAAIDRTDRGANPGLLILLIVCLLGAVGLFYFLPGGQGTKLLFWHHYRARRIRDFLDSFCSRSAFCNSPARPRATIPPKRSPTPTPTASSSPIRESRIIYANEAYMTFSGAHGAADLRVVERLFSGAPEVSEAIYRLAQAAREGKRGAEELRMSPPLTGEAAVAWYRIRVRPLENFGRGRATLWTVSDITRERERHENVFQELQHAIDYLDHAPAGFFSVEPGGADFLSERHPRRLARL